MQRTLTVTITDRELVIKGERKAEKDEKEKDYSYREISYGSFERRFLLPEGVKTEDLKAKFNNGILEISVPVPSCSEGEEDRDQDQGAKEDRGRGQKGRITTLH